MFKTLDKTPLGGAAVTQGSYAPEWEFYVLDDNNCPMPYAAVKITPSVEGVCRIDRPIKQADITGLGRVTFNIEPVIQ
jgi:hypothetical protein